ncbi:hypothetical protein [Actinosynnema sp. ALI-1.44]|nr:hypothetical protein [Actinosynnema sp. ALI-1.44]
MSVLTEDPAETVMPMYREVLDPVGFKGLRQGSQGVMRRQVIGGF